MTPGNFKERKARALKISKALEKVFPESKSVLTYKSSCEFVVAVILSAQTTDKKVNEVTQTLFKKYRTPDDYAKATPATLAKDIYPVSFFRNKAKNIIGAAKVLKKAYGGKVPKSVAELTTLPGV